MPRRLAALLLASALLPAPALAQQGGGGVPAYEPPPPVSTERDGKLMEGASRRQGSDKGGDTQAASSVVANFASAYARNGKPKLALYWNRQLSETLTEWYSDTRVVNRETTTGGMSGEINLNQSGSTENVTAIERRVTDPRRVTTSESFEWEFQEGFLAPFLEAGVTVLDRAAIMRLTGVDMAGAGERTVETRALQGKADYLLEILVAPNQRATTGFELRTRILDVKTGAIVAMVNSKNLREWNQPKGMAYTENGFVDLDEEDEDSFGPQGEERFRATATGFERRRKPPKLPKVAQTLAHNTMNGLMRQWTK